MGNLYEGSGKGIYKVHEFLESKLFEEKLEEIKIFSLKKLSLRRGNGQFKVYLHNW